MAEPTESASQVPDAAPGEARKGSLTVRGATFLGIGSMIGAGIFALLGEAGAVAGAAVWISFLIGGVVAMLLGYVCVKLGSRYPSKGGLITYLIEGFGRGRLAILALAVLLDFWTGRTGHRGAATPRVGPAASN